ncbi:MAG: Ig-like domain-containing protein [Planctomycetaceae bacterium]|jgi:hypothetical protein|nr:Ig-like domain-containing protein [Planctomycetaceae bacterium]
MKMFWISVCFGLLGLVGCGISAPPGFPSLKDCRVTVTDNGQPIPDVVVNLVPKFTVNSLFITGVTDVNGTAVIKTRHGEYSRNGAPEGDYSVILSKSIDVEMPILTEEQSLALTPAQQNARQKEREKKMDAARIIPIILEEPSQTPLTLQIGNETGKLSVDIAEYKTKK